MLVWLDIETSGLDPRRDSFFELGMKITTDSLTVIDQFSTPIKPDWWYGLSEYGLRKLRQMMIPLVFDMHMASGLFKDIDRYGVDKRTAENMAMHWLIDSKADQKPSAGSTVAFDRSFLEAQMPGLHTTFHYRRIDVSTLKELSRIWAPNFIMESAPGKAHRVLDDIDDSIAELAHYREKILKV